MESYPSYVNGQDVDAEKWINVLHSTALLDEPFEALSLKRELDRGGEADENDPRIAGRVGVSTPEQAEQALAAARQAQRGWARVPFEQRLAFGEAVHATVVERADEFVEKLVAEGHPHRLAQWEVAGVIQGSSPETLRANAAMVESVSNVDQREVRITRKPDGVVCLSPPQNAAASNSMCGLPALIAGNALVVKAPRSGPLATAWAWRELVAPLLAKFGAPPGTLSILCDAPQRLLKQWLKSPHVDDVMFFGASERGLSIEQRCVEHGKKPILELAGNDGVLVWSDAEVSLAARAIAECFYGSAQICMVPKYVLVHPDVAEDLIEQVRHLLTDIHPGRPEDPETLLSPVYKTNDFFATLESALQAGTLLYGGQRVDYDGTPSSSGVFVEPTLVRVDGLDAADSTTAVREETFYPLLPIVVPDRAADDGDLLTSLIDFMNRNKYGLRNSLWATDASVIEEFCERMSNGGLLKINDSHIGFVPGLPTHGGTGNTGGVHGECNFPMLRTTHMQGISIATGVTPRPRVFDSALPPRNNA